MKAKKLKANVSDGHHVRFYLDLSCPPCAAHQKVKHEKMKAKKLNLYPFLCINIVLLLKNVLIYI